MLTRIDCVFIVLPKVLREIRDNCPYLKEVVFWQTLDDKVITSKEPSPANVLEILNDWPKVSNFIQKIYSIVNICLSNITAGIRHHG